MNNLNTGDTGVCDNCKREVDWEFGGINVIVSDIPYKPIEHLCDECVNLKEDYLES